MINKGIILAGGSGTRLYPLTLVANKQLQPVYDKPMVYYPLATLMLGGIRDILLISSAEELPRFQELLGDGSHLGISLTYKVQVAAEGIAQALLIAESFIDQQPVALILGDNIFYGQIHLDKLVREFSSGAMIFGYNVQNPERYGVLELSESGEVLSLVEKPKQPRSNLAIPGLYLYDATSVERVKQLVPSKRGELEITDLNLAYLRANALRAQVLGRGIVWLDTGTHESLLEAANFIATVEQRQGLKIACLEEIAFRQGFLDAVGLERCVAGMPRSPYRDYCATLIKEKL